MENQNPAQSEPVQNPIQSSQAPVPPIPPSIDKPKRSFPIPKIAFLGIVFIILLAIIGSAYLLGKNNASKQSPTPTISQSPTPTVDPTADWKTYTSEKLGFSLKYPDSLVIAPETATRINGDVTLILKEEENLDLNSRSMNLDIFFRGKPGTSASDALKSETPTGPGCINAPLGSSCNPKTEKIELNNAEGLSVDRGVTVLDYYITDAKLTKPALRIVVMSLGNKKNNYDIGLNSSSIELFKKVVGTFKFTN